MPPKKSHVETAKKVVKSALARASLRKVIREDNERLNNSKTIKGKKKRR